MNVSRVDSAILQFLRLNDIISGGILFSMVVMAPWMLGVTTFETILVMNWLGFILGALWITKSVAMLDFGLEPTPDRPRLWSTAIVIIVVLLVLLLLCYVLCSALNPKAALRYTFMPGIQLASGVEIEYLSAIEWLPHSYDRDRTLRAFWKYLAIVFSFFAARDWLVTRSSVNNRNTCESTRFPNHRMQCLLWTMSINAAGVALVGILQRLDGSQKLLWLFSKHLNGTEAAFGPFPYRSNGAQYLNLMWPVTVGFWLVLHRRSVIGYSYIHRLGSDPYLLLLLLATLTVAGVFVANSRGGVLVLFGLMVLVIAWILVKSKWRPSSKFAALMLTLIVLFFGGWLGGSAILTRFKAEDFKGMSGRDLIYKDTDRMVNDFAVFGSGAENFAPLYFFYRKCNPNWDAYAHNDYLETLVTFGWVGLVIILILFLSIWLVPFFGDGIGTSQEFIVFLGLAMAGMMVHARYDLPFQIYSLHFEFVILCSLLSCLKWEKNTPFLSP
jgi:hypothetical protein